MIGFNVQVTGLEKTQDMLRVLPKKVKDHVNVTNYQFANDVANAMKINLIRHTKKESRDKMAQTIRSYSLCHLIP